MSLYTVIGLVDQDGELTVAGVVAGEHPMLDSDPGSAEDGTQRWAGCYDAPDAAHAEALSVADASHDDTGSVT